MRMPERSGKSELWVAGERMGSQGPCPSSPDELCPDLPDPGYEIATPLLSCDSFHTMHLNWGRKWNSFNTHFPSKEPGSFRR